MRKGSLTVSLEPKLKFLVYGLAGVSAGITPSADIVFETGTGQPLERTAAMRMSAWTSAWLGRGSTG